MKPLTRPALRYHGGKWRLAPRLLALFPPHRVYVEPFGGGGSVLLRKSRSYAEVYNDLDSEIVSFFQVLRDPALSEQLETSVRQTPFARAEFEAAYVGQADDPVERARRLLIRSFMGFGSDGCNAARNTGFRSNSNRSGTTPVHDWVNYADQISAFSARLHGVVIENRPAISVMQQHDGPDTLHYCDPPYVHETRTAKGKAYRFEMSDADHADFLDVVCDLKGAVIVSGYACDLYDNRLSDWAHVDINTFADGARARVERVWLNKAASAPDLFGGEYA